jgi:lipoprotein NlpI
MGVVYLKMNDYENAVKYFDICLNLDPTWINNKKVLDCMNFFKHQFEDFE